ncbi:hypothetical protein B0H13DRAFT_2276759 [Mycena leptocephala]|nr:hypothetical protein B0H13DRAFT_2276759 [Mycena leptocephala]
MAFLGEDIQNGGPRWILMRGLDLMRGRLDDVRQFLANAAHIRFGASNKEGREEQEDDCDGKKARLWRASSVRDPSWQRSLRSRASSTRTSTTLASATALADGAHLYARSVLVNPSACCRHYMCVTNIPASYGSHSPRRAYSTPALRATCCLPAAPVVPDDGANLPRSGPSSVPQPTKILFRRKLTYPGHGEHVRERGRDISSPRKDDITRRPSRILSASLGNYASSAAFWVYVPFSNSPSSYRAAVAIHLPRSISRIHPHPPKTAHAAGDTRTHITASTRRDHLAFQSAPNARSSWVLDEDFCPREASAQRLRAAYG